MNANEQTKFIRAKLTRSLEKKMLGGCAANKESENNPVIEHRWGRFSGIHFGGEHCWVERQKATSYTVPANSVHSEMQISLAECWMVIFPNGEIVRMNTLAALQFLRAERDQDGIVYEIGGIPQQHIEHYEYEMSR